MLLHHLYMFLRLKDYVGLQVRNNALVQQVFFVIHRDDLRFMILRFLIRFAPGLAIVVLL